MIDNGSGAVIADGAGFCSYLGPGAVRLAEGPHDERDPVLASHLDRLLLKHLGAEPRHGYTFVIG